MNLARLKSELSVIIRDDSLEPYFTDWLNDAVNEIATDFDLPYLRLLSPESFAVTTSTWLYDPPATYHKNLFKATDSNWTRIYVCKRWEEMDSLDLDHDETGDNVTTIAVTEEAQQIGIYPLATETIKLWYYKKPTDMEDEDDEPSCIPEHFRYRVLIPKVVIRNFKLLQDLMVQVPHQSLMWWEEELRRGLYGSPRGDIGMINFFAKARKPKKSGGSNPLP